MSSNLITLSAAGAAGAEEYWIVTLGGAGSDYGRGIAVDASGNVYITGYTNSQGAGGQDLIVAKYNTSGTIQWQRSLGGTGSDYGRGIAVDAGGNIYITGYTNSQGAGVQDLIVAKYNTSGTIQWQRSLGGTGIEYGLGIAVDASGNVYITGYTDSQGAGGIDALIVKYNTSGTLQWQRSLGGAGTDISLGIAVDASGNVYITGYTDSQGAGGQDLIVAKYNTSGTIQWQRSLGGAGTEYGYGIAVDASGNVYITGYTSSQGAGWDDVLVSKYNTSGTIQWQRSLGGGISDYGYGIAVDASGNVYITGYTASQGAGNTDLLIAKYNTSGTIQWQRSLGGTGAEYGYDIAVDASGNVYITGYTNSQGAGGIDLLIAKLPDDGSLTGHYGNFAYSYTTLTDAATTLTDAATTLTDAPTTLTDAATTLTDAARTLTSSLVHIPEPYWIATLGGAGSDYGRGIAVDASGNIYVAGYTNSQGAGSNDVLIARYNTSGNIQWQRSLGGTGTDVGRGIAVDASGNVYIIGYTGSQGAGGLDALITKYNASGTIQWQRSLGGTGAEYGYGIAVDASGNVYIASYTSSQGAGGTDVLIAKYNTSGALQWQRSLGGAGTEYGYGIAVDASGSVYVTGSTSSQGAGSNDVLIAKYNTSGTIQWQRSLGGTGNEYGYGIAVDASGNVYVVGYTGSQGAGIDDVLVAKYNTSGTIQWQRSLGGTGNEYGWGIYVDASGNVYVAGSTTSQGAGAADALITKYNTSGTIQWQRSLGGTGTEYGYGLAVDASGNVYVTGTTNSQGAGGYDVLIAKLPGDGSLTGTYGNLRYAVTTLTDAATTLTDAPTTLTDAPTTLTDAPTTLTDAARTLTSTTTLGDDYWIATLGGANTEYGRGIAVDTSGNIYVTGYTNSQGAGDYDTLITKYNTSGTIQWQRSLGGAVAEYGTGIAVDASGNVYVAGYTNSQGAGNYDVLVAKYNTSGTLQWQRSLGGAGTDVSYGIAVDASGNVYVAGYTASQGAGGADVLIAKYDTSGTLQWQRSLGGAGNDIGWSIAVDVSGNVYVAGYTDSQGAGNYDVLIAKYDTTGTLQWQRSLGGAGADVSYGIAVDASGNVYVAGYTNSQGAGGIDFLIAKYNTSGTLQWQRSLGGTGTEYGYSIAVDASGNVYLAGYTISQGAGGNDVLIAKLPGDGSRTGIYGSLKYMFTTLTDAATTLTDAPTTLTDAPTTLTDSARTLTDAARTLTSTTISV